jgi:uncharacterized protein (TIGR03905 family)
MIEYRPTGTCSQKILFDINDNKITDLKFIAGCPGNLNGICSLVVGMDVDEVISKLKGTPCGSKSTSCPDQLAKALLEWKKSKNTISCHTSV